MKANRLGVITAGGEDEEAQNLLQDSRILQALRVSGSPAAVPQTPPDPRPPTLSRPRLPGRAERRWLCTCQAVWMAPRL